MTDLERLAKAVVENRVGHKISDEQWGMCNQSCLISDVRAILQALREPSEGMLMAVNDIDTGSDCVDCGRYPAEETFRAMINHILEGK